MTDAPLNTDGANQPVQTAVDPNLPALPDLNSGTTPVQMTDLPIGNEPVQNNTVTDMPVVEPLQEQSETPITPVTPVTPLATEPSIPQTIPVGENEAIQNVPSPDSQNPIPTEGQVPEQNTAQAEPSTKQPLIITAQKLSNIAMRTFVMEYLKGNNNDYKDTLEQIQTIDEMIEKGELTEEELIKNPIGL
jgi:hypothetical protein